MDIFNILSMKINTAGNPTKEQFEAQKLRAQPACFYKIKAEFPFLIYANLYKKVKKDIQHQLITHLYGEGEAAMENTLIRQ